MSLTFERDSLKTKLATLQESSNEDTSDVASKAMESKQMNLIEKEKQILELKLETEKLKNKLKEQSDQFSKNLKDFETDFNEEKGNLQNEIFKLNTEREEKDKE